MDKPTIKTELFDFGAKIGVAVEYNGQRRAVRIDNPFWPEMDAEWKRTHSSTSR
jgi:predicted DNA-binding ribbon-helix-helix protein